MITYSPALSRQKNLIPDFGRTPSQTSVLPGALKDLLAIGLGSVFVGVLAQLAFPLPWTPVPVTAQTLGVILVGAALGPKRGALAILLYLAEGAWGLPVFAGGAFGPAHLIGPTAGYLYGFVAAAFLVGLLSGKGMDRKIWTAFPAFLLGHALIFSLGVFWLSFFVGKENALSAGLIPFLPGMLFKTLVAASTLPFAWKLTRDFGLHS